MNLRMCEIVTDFDKLKVDLQEVFMKYTTIKKWAYIIHDKDDTRPHYHIALHFGGACVDMANIAKWFDLCYTDVDGKEHDGMQFINKIKGRWTDLLQYLTHRNESQKNKYQYDTKDVVANFDFESEIEQAQILGDFEHYSYARQLQYVNSLPVSDKVKAFSQLRKLWEIHCQWLTLQSDRNLQVFFFTGSAGSGKTYYAKKFLNSLNFDFCISSCSNDPFQDYLGQKGIILDDIRDFAFDFEDLLKILDNNTMSTVKSRFNNKVFNGDIIVLTSKVPLVYWYKHRDSKGNYYNFSEDDLKQLYRRITCYVNVSKTEVFVYPQGVDDLGKPQGRAVRYRNELADISFSSDSSSKNLSDRFGDFCELSDNSYIQPSLISGDTNIF